MRQFAVVTALLPDGRAQVSVCRKSACAGDCHSCGGCGAVSQTLTVIADNPLGAPPGARVFIETPGNTVLRAAALIYLLPLVLFLTAYLLAMPLGAWAAAVGAGAFALGCLPAVWYDRRRRSRPIPYQIVEAL